MSRANGQCSPVEKDDREDFLITSGHGECGGALTFSISAEPKSLNPLTVVDRPSRDIAGLMTADLVHINRLTHEAEPALAKSWRVSPDGRRYTLQLRRGVRFSDGHPFDADDVLFSFHAYLEERVSSPQRDLLMIGGQPISVTKQDAYTVMFTLAKPYAAGERIFDSIAILPRHLLDKADEQGTLRNVWNLQTPAAKIAGLGPFRMREYVPGQRIVLERNPFYWKRDSQGFRLPYLNALTALFIPNADAEALRFRAGELDLINRLSSDDFENLRKSEGTRYRVFDAGRSLEFNMLVFNLNHLQRPDFDYIRRKQAWFEEIAFRKAISEAIDRKSMIRLAYEGRAYPLTTHVPPGDKRWINHDLPVPSRSLERARAVLRKAGFNWNEDGRLVDREGQPIEFSLTYSAGKPQYQRMVTVIQSDLDELGIRVTPVPVEFRDLLSRVLNTYNYEAALMTLLDDSADPNSEISVLSSHAPMHLWDIKSDGPAPAWQEEIDRLMEQQLTAMHYEERKRIYDRVQELMFQNLPMIFLVSPDVLVGANATVENFKPAIMPNYILWDVEELFIRRQGTRSQ